VTGSVDYRPAPLPVGVVTRAAAARVDLVDRAARPPGIGNQAES